MTQLRVVLPIDLLWQEENEEHWDVDATTSQFLADFRDHLDMNGYDDVIIALALTPHMRVFTPMGFEATSEIDNIRNILNNTTIEYIGLE